MPQDQVMEFPMETEFGLKSQILNVSLVRISRSDCSNKQSPNISDLTQEKKNLLHLSPVWEVEETTLLYMAIRDTFGT